MNRTSFPTTAARLAAGVLTAAGLLVGGRAGIAAADTPTFKTPQIIAVTAADSHSITVTWQDTNPSEDRVYVAYAEGRIDANGDGPGGHVDIVAPPPRIAHVPLGTGTHTVQNLKAGISYCVRVKSQKANDNNVPQSAWSEPVCARTPLPIDVKSTPAGGEHAADLLRPALGVSRISGPTELYQGAQQVYEFVVFNEGYGDAQNVAVSFGFTGTLQGVQLVQEASGFTCTQQQDTWTCTGTLKGTSDGQPAHSASFLARGWAAAKGTGTTFATINADHRLTEVNYGDDSKAVAVTVK